MTIYISGPITGNPDYKKDFERIENWLLENMPMTLDVGCVNPAKLDLGENATWEDYMRRDIKLLMDCDAIFMMKGWRKSRGAKIERKIAKMLKMKIWYEG